MASKLSQLAARFRAQGPWRNAASLWSNASAFRHSVFGHTAFWRSVLWRGATKQRFIPLWLAVAAASSSGACGAPVQFEDANVGGKGEGGEDASGGRNSGGRTGSDSGGKGEGGEDASGGNGQGGTDPMGTGSKPGSGGDTTGPSGGMGPGTGGTPDPGVNGQPGGAVVTLGARMKSANYSIVLTVGETPGGNGTMRSTNYRLRTGLVATTEGD
jgi:hypothetical protein